MLVLLIIFMVTASLGQQGITVRLPQTKAQPLTVSSDTVVVSIDTKLNTYIDSAQVPETELTARLVALFVNRVNKIVFLKADKAVSYGDFMHLVGLIKAAGVEQLGMEPDVPEPSP